MVSWVRCGTWSYRFLIFGVFLTKIYFTGKICALVAAVVKTQRVFSSHGGFSVCVKLDLHSIRAQRKCWYTWRIAWYTIHNGHIEFETLVDQVDVTTCKEMYSKKTCLNEFLVILSLKKPKNWFWNVNKCVHWNKTYCKKNSETLTFCFIYMYQ